MELGFSLEQVEEALLIYNGNEELAGNYLATRAESADELAAENFD